MEGKAEAAGEELRLRNGCDVECATFVWRRGAIVQVAFVEVHPAL